METIESWKRKAEEYRKEYPYRVTFVFSVDHYGTHEQIERVRDRVQRELELMFAGQEVEVGVDAVIQSGGFTTDDNDDDDQQLEDS